VPAPEIYMKLFKLESYDFVTAWGDTWRVTILADKATGGKAYAEAHIKVLK